MAPDAATLATLCAALRDDSFAVVSGLLPPALLLALSEDCAAAEQSGQLRAAHTGRAAHGQGNPTLRGDSIVWLEDDVEGSPQSEFLQRMGALRSALNRELMLGLDALEAHYAIYPPGTGYARHRDRFRDDDARVLSLVVYLNDGWREEDGGELRMYLPCGPRDVRPERGTSVLFLSAEIEHEVLTARRARSSIAGWFRQRAATSLF